MDFQQFLGGSNEAQAWSADVERTVNWYPEVSQSQNATRKVSLLPTPGVQLLGVQLTESLRPVYPGRAHAVAAGREFAVQGTLMWEYNRLGWLASRLSVAASSYPATISSNGDGGGQLFVCSGGSCYYFTMATNVGALLSAPASTTGYLMGDYLEGYFLCLRSDNSTLYLSALFNGASWTTGADFAQRTFRPDQWVSLKVLGRYAWLLGTESSEAWYNTGGTFPLAPHPGSVIDYGCAAAWSPKVVGNSLCWLAQTAGGRRCVVRMAGFEPQIISTYALETKFQGYKHLEDAVGDVYSDESGHTFYILHFDRDGISWAWDMETGLWSERGTWISEEHRWEAWRPRFLVDAFGERRLLDPKDASVYRAGPKYTRDVDNRPIRRLRRAPAINNENDRLFYKSFEVELDRGKGDINAHENLISFTWSQAAGNIHDITVDASATTVDYGPITSYVWTWQTPPQPAVGHTAVETFTVPSHVHVTTALAEASFGVTLTVVTPRGSFSAFAKINTSTKGASGGVSEYRATPDDQKTTPQVMLRLSNDGGKTWPVETWSSAGEVGEYNKRVKWHRLGAARRRVFEVSVTDDIPWRLTGAYADVSK